MAPSFCGCPNLTTISWMTNESFGRKAGGGHARQKHNDLILLPVVAGHMLHMDHDTAEATGRVGQPVEHHQALRMTFEAMNNGYFQGHSRSLLPSGVQLDTPVAGAVDPNRLVIDTPQIRNMLRSVRIARQNGLRAVASESHLANLDSDQVALEAAVDRDLEDFERAVQGATELGFWRNMAFEMRGMRQTALRQEVQRSALTVLAAARTLACQVEPLASRVQEGMPGWLRLPPESRSLCMRNLDEIDIPGYDDLKIGHALSQSQMQTVLSFASDRKTIGYGRANEVLLASKRLTDETALEAHQAGESSAKRTTSAVQDKTESPANFAAPRWSWKKAAERCMPQDWVTQVAWNKYELMHQLPTPRGKNV